MSPPPQSGWRLNYDLKLGETLQTVYYTSRITPSMCLPATELEYYILAVQQKFSLINTCTGSIIHVYTLKITELRCCFTCFY